LRNGLVHRLVKLRCQLARTRKDADVGSPKLHGHMCPPFLPYEGTQRPATVLLRALLPPQPFAGLSNGHASSIAVGGFFLVPYAGSPNWFASILALLPVLGLEPISNRQVVSHHCEQLVCGVPVRIVTQQGAVQ